MSIDQRIEKALEEIRPVLQADGGNIEVVAVEGDTVAVRLQGACAGCPSANETLRNIVEEKIREHCPEIYRVVDVTAAERKSAPAMHGDAFEGQMPVEGVQSIVAVASGKGGVGKSTVAVNLALALQQRGLSVGLLDADVYGQSIPKMMGTTSVPQPGEDGILPVEKHGVKVMSIGFYLDQNTPVIWRGPMVMKALSQFLRDVTWGALDCLVVDLPPGTGDAQLTIVQAVPVTGAVVVTTPSDVALIDARRAIGMFEKVAVPVVGIVENMSHFVCPHCGESTAVFSQGGGEAAAKAMRVPFLGGIPLHPAIGQGGDQGRPIMVAQPDQPEAKAFVDLATSVDAYLEQHAGDGQPAIH
ncbi:MAG: P-loop NTPase [Deltaproteobacteria bacterium]|jgi:ATP-binding protein involved in chromosome partitioning|nr:P-loop NTPase [Deltaproteobacteria bacterium]MBW2533686.1 P-loop NTPase [Deltaproteobacteria bacterium]